MTDKTFLTKTKVILLLLTALFACAVFAVKSAQTPAVVADNYVVSIQHSERQSASEAQVEEVGPINVNTATAEQLQLLPGIGPVKAQAIVDYRQAHGNFTCAEDLLNVSGIGAVTLEEIRNDITWEVTP